MRRLALLAAGLVLASCGSDDGAQPPPGPDRFLDGGRPAFEQFIERQRGKPVVVNKWASWCGPCRAEFPHFRAVARRLRGEVAFVGVNSNDNDGDARRFLADNPVPYRHFRDPKLEVAAAFDAVQAFPATAFYDRRGELAYVHQGGYRGEAEIVEDVDRYAR